MRERVCEKERKGKREREVYIYIYIYLSIKYMLDDGNGTRLKKSSTKDSLFPTHSIKEHRKKKTQLAPGQLKMEGKNRINTN